MHLYHKNVLLYYHCRKYKFPNKYLTENRIRWNRILYCKHVMGLHIYTYVHSCRFSCFHFHLYIYFYFYLLSFIYYIIIARPVKKIPFTSRFMFWPLQYSSFMTKKRIMRFFTFFFFYVTLNKLYLLHFIVRKKKYS